MGGGGLDALSHPMVFFNGNRFYETIPISFDEAYLWILYQQHMLMVRTLKPLKKCIMSKPYQVWPTLMPFLGVGQFIANQLGSMYNILHDLVNGLLLLSQEVKFNVINSPKKKKKKKKKKKNWNLFKM